MKRNVSEIRHFHNLMQYMWRTVLYSLLIGCSEAIIAVVTFAAWACAQLIRTEYSIRRIYYSKP